MSNDPIHILLANDDEDDRLFFQDAFKEIKIKTQLRFVNDGEELMVHLNQNGNTLPHMLFLHLNMPRKNGIECLVEIKRMPRLQNMAIADFILHLHQSRILKTHLFRELTYTSKSQVISQHSKVSLKM